MDEKLKKIIIYVSAGFIILLIILFAVSSCQGKKANYSSYEEKMEKAAISYFDKHEDEKPTEDKKTSEYSLKEMIENGDIEDYTKSFGDENIKCEGGVTITNNNGYYLYTTELDCGDSYSSQTLTDKIKEDSLAETGQGLYQIGDEYVFRGDKINNYVTFAGETWRIISIGDNGDIRLLQEKTSLSSIWDNHYNSDINETGINVYYQGEGKPSNVMQKLSEYYKDKINEKAKPYITTQTACYGARSKSDITTDGSTECSSYIDGQPLSLIAVYEYLRASIDEECTSLSTKSCKNFNWLYKIDSTYFITPTTEKGNYVYYFYNGVKDTMTNNYLSVLLKVQIDGKVNYKSGDGSKENPYQIGEVIKKK